MKIPPGHTLVVNPHYEETKNMKRSPFASAARRNPGAKDLAMTAGEGLGIGLLAAGMNYGVMKLAQQPADASKKPVLRGHAVGVSQMVAGVVLGAAIDQGTGRRDVAVGTASALSALGFRDEWAYMAAQKAAKALADAAAAAAARTPAVGGQGSTPAATGGGQGFSRGLPAGVVVPANPFAAYYK